MSRHSLQLARRLAPAILPCVVRARCGEAEGEGPTSARVQRLVLLVGGGFGQLATSISLRRSVPLSRLLGSGGVRRDVDGGHCSLRGTRCERMVERADFVYCYRYSQPVAGIGTDGNATNDARRTSHPPRPDHYCCFGATWDGEGAVSTHKAIFVRLQSASFLQVRRNLCILRSRKTKFQSSIRQLMTSGEPAAANHHPTSSLAMCHL
ncbi:hypothetical protein P280DRAFT_482683 [Massarina eburnea CBS 473.64]|uniref:Uncharacterized protein n=1 Tax=Massarina eburnea CBS 473.64 TaxID=1395130 RepID=A0A6A6RTS3_9PLEO|nr:hypothetical protein P280DRAFT_482683 [Massarina eburnea CBS 473.64]